MFPGPEPVVTLAVNVSGVEPGVGRVSTVVGSVVASPPGCGADVDAAVGVELPAVGGELDFELLQPSDNNSAGMTTSSALNRAGTAAGVITTSPS